jgi:hypothetical protein
MASGAANMLRDFGFTLGPAVVGAITLSRAAEDIQAKLASDSALARQLAVFNASAAKNAALKPVVGAVNSGPLGANSVPNPPNPLKNVAFDALGHSNSIGYLVCGIAALVSALLVILALGGGTRDNVITGESLAEDE